MTRYAVDADIWAIIQRARQVPAIEALGQLPVVITDAVWDELTVVAASKGARPGTVSEMEQLLRTMAGAPTVLQPGTPEGIAFGRLHSGPLTENAGEHSLIAYASQHADVIAVLFDRTALYKGVEELQGRVLSLHGFLNVLQSSHGLAHADADTISRWACSARGVRQPLWW